MLLAAAGLPAAAQGYEQQSYEREARKAKETLATLDRGEPVWITQPNGHRFLGLWLPAAQPRGVVIVAHGRGWSPDVDLYGELRVLLAEAGWSTLSIQMPVMEPSASKLGDYIITYPDAINRFTLAVDWVKARSNLPLAIVSHSLGATMANQYLIRTKDGKVGAWAFLSILNGLEDMFRLNIPVLDLYAEHDWGVISIGADERRKQIERIPGSRQIMMRGAQHFYDGQRPEVAKIIVDFLDAALIR